MIIALLMLAAAAQPPSKSFTQLEIVIMQDIQVKQENIQREIADFYQEVQKEHPGYQFNNGNLVPIPPAPTPPQAAPAAAPKK